MGTSGENQWKSIRSKISYIINNSIVFRTVVACCVLFAQHTSAVSNHSFISVKTQLTGSHRSGDIPKQSHYTDQWAVHIQGGPVRAHHIAKKHGFINTGEIFQDHYHFIHKNLPKRSTDPCHEFHQLLSSEDEVIWHAQQTVKKRVKRDYIEIGNSKITNVNTKRRAARKYQLTFTDPRWPVMWYLNRGPGLDMNVQEAWEEGITGKGIVVTILDDGLEKDHPDIVRNYDPMASFDVNSFDMDPMPTYDLTDSNRHGTRCAGEVAAEANNSICAIGIAFEAGVGGVRMLDGDVTDAVEARSLSHNPQHIDIYSASWGPDDDGKTVDGPGELATRAFVEGITKGRGGKGSIFVWASGNGGRDHDNCNCDGYTNSIWTLSISSATENGLVPWYSEACSSTLATTYSSGGTGEKQIVTIDLHHSCTSSHTGTSASAPLAAGICALALQANKNLTWRDMQHIVVRTARPHNLIAPDWATNGVGRNVSHSFGYGLMDAGAMVKLSRKWRTVPEQNKCEVRAPYTDKNIPAKSKVTLEIKVSDCPGVKFLEHVQAKVTMSSVKRGDLLIFLISPSGTRSVLLANRRHDLNRSGFTDWPFMTVHCWGENPVGKWVLEIHNEGRYSGFLKTWAVVLHGIPGDPNGPIDTIGTEPSQEIVNPTVEVTDMLEFDGSENKVILEHSHMHNPHLAASTPEVADISSVTSAGTPCIKNSISGSCLECPAGLFLFQDSCLTVCPAFFHGVFEESINRKGVPIKSGSGNCLPCHYSCRTCSGDTENNCTSCFSDSTLISQRLNPNEPPSSCYPTHILNTIENNAFWYRALVVIVIANISVLLLLIVYVCLRKKVQGQPLGRGWLETKGEYRRVSPDEDNPLDDGMDVDVQFSIPSHPPEVIIASSSD